MDCPSDIVFVVDDSRRVGSSNFARMKSFLSRLVNGLDLDSGITRVGLLTYSSYARVRFYLSYYSSVSSVRSAISRLTYSGTSSTTNTAVALAYVRKSMLASTRGDRSDSPNIVVVLTAGRSSSTSATQV